jgi:DHA2 family multidrug resistance protein
MRDKIVCPCSLSEMAVSTYRSPATTAVEAPEVHTHKWLVAAAVMVGAFLQVLDSTVVSVALPHKQGGFAASADGITALMFCPRWGG